MPIQGDGDFGWRNLVNALPAAVYTTDAGGQITFYNEAAATLWGCRPEIGRSEWCGSWKLYWPDGCNREQTLDGIIASWNRGAERLFGYTAEEVIGEPITILIPAERHDEEPGILAPIQRGEHIDHYETVRRHLQELRGQAHRRGSAHGGAGPAPFAGAHARPAGR